MEGRRPSPVSAETQDVRSCPPRVAAPSSLAPLFVRHASSIPERKSTDHRRRDSPPSLTSYLFPGTDPSADAMSEALVQRTLISAKLHSVLWQAALNRQLRKLPIVLLNTSAGHDPEMLRAHPRSFGRTFGPGPRKPPFPTSMPRCQPTKTAYCTINLRARTRPSVEARGPNRRWQPTSKSCCQFSSERARRRARCPSNHRGSSSREGLPPTRPCTDSKFDSVALGRGLAERG